MVFINVTYRNSELMMVISLGLGQRDANLKTYFNDVIASEVLQMRSQVTPINIQ